MTLVEARVIASPTSGLSTKQMSDAPIENVAVEGGKKCPAGKVKDAVSGRCRKRKCGRGRTRSGSGRCHRLKKSGPHRENAPSSRRVRGGEEAPVVVGGY